jgi:hypothetical protein
MHQPSLRKSYVMRVQHDSTEWQFSLTDVQNGERQEFATIGTLIVFLENLAENPKKPRALLNLKSTSQK